MRPKLLAAALCGLALAASPVHAASTELEKLEKKVARYAQPSAELDVTKARGICVCQSDDPAVQGLTGVLVYDVEAGFDVDRVRVGCLVPSFTPDGVPSGNAACGSWTVLGR